MLHYLAGPLHPRAFVQTAGCWSRCVLGAMLPEKGCPPWTQHDERIYIWPKGACAHLVQAAKVAQRCFHVEA